MVGSGGAAPTRGQDEDVRVRVRADDGTFSLPLPRLGRSAPFAGAAMLRSSTAHRRNHEVAARPHEGRTPVPDIPNQRVHRALRHDRPVRRLRGRGRTLEVHATPTSDTSTASTANSKCVGAPR
jgi:hypothetical protein